MIFFGTLILWLAVSCPPAPAQPHFAAVPERASASKGVAKSSEERAPYRLRRATSTSVSACERDAEPALELGIVQNFNRWRLRFGQPVFCPVCLCNSSCKDFADACTLNSQAQVLGYFPAAAKLISATPSGCGGACLQASSQVGCCPD